MRCPKTFRIDSIALELKQQQLQFFTVIASELTAFFPVRLEPAWTFVPTVNCIPLEKLRDVKSEETVAEADASL